MRTRTHRTNCDLIGFRGRLDLYARTARVAEQLAAIKGKFIMSINDTPEIREAFAAFILDEVRSPYTFGRQASEQKARELIISNADALAGLL
jgi:DNA adenine methylase